MCAIINACTSHTPVSLYLCFNVLIYLTIIGKETHAHNMINAHRFGYICMQIYLYSPIHIYIYNAIQHNQYTVSKCVQACNFNNGVLCVHVCVFMVTFACVCICMSICIHVGVYFFKTVRQWFLCLVRQVLSCSCLLMRDTELTYPNMHTDWGSGGQSAFPNSLKNRAVKCKKTLLLKSQLKVKAKFK